MPIIQRVVFVCSECGRKEVRQIGDVRPDPNEFKPCPKCGAMMQATDEDPDSIGTIFDEMKRVFGGIF